jgi:hypothetical protein
MGNRKINVYIITYGPHRIEEEKACIESVYKKSQEQSDFDVKIFLCDNNSPVEFTDWVKENYGDEIKCFFSKKNIGKARIVNHVHKNLARPSDYIISMDGDMVIQDDCDVFFQSMTRALHQQLNIGGNVIPIGAVSSQQLICPAHIMDKIDMNFKVEKFNYKTSFSAAIAGGCLCMFTNTFNHIGCYQETTNIFGGNDGIIMAKLGQIKALPCVAVDAMVEHRGCDDSEELKKYHEWKVKQAYSINKEKEFVENTGYFDK